jgi:prepilin-type processing-associated H-X9-DG protein
MKHILTANLNGLSLQQEEHVDISVGTRPSSGAATSEVPQHSRQVVGRLTGGMTLLCPRRARSGPPSGGRSAFTLVEVVVIVALLAFLGCLLVPALSRTQPSSQTLQCQNNLRQLQRAHTMYGTDNLRLISNPGGTSIANNIWAPGWQDWNVGIPAGANTNAALLTSSIFSPYYGGSAGVLKCPEDKVPGVTGPRIRSISMNGFVGGTTMKDVYGYTTYLMYQKESDFTRPGPAKTWVFLDEHPDSINDGLFGMHMPSSTVWPTYSTWDDMPASYHNGACGFSFADGHTEVRKWVDDNTKAPILKVNPSSGTGRTSPKDNAWMDARSSAPL